MFSYLPRDLIREVNTLIRSNLFESELAIGDKIHLGFGVKGGVGFIGHIKTIKDNVVTISHPDGNEYVGYLDKATKIDDGLTDYYKKASRYFYRTEAVDESMKPYIKKAMKNRFKNERCE